MVIGCSGLFWRVPVCSGLLRHVSCRSTLQTSTLTRKFIKDELHVRIFQKAGQWLLQSVAPLMYYKVGQMLLQTGAFF